MIIELYGLPGSGKSTYAKGLSERIDIPVTRTAGFFDCVRWWLIFILYTPRSAFRIKVLLMQNAEGFRELYTRAMNGILDRFARYEKASRGGGILDEGPLQNTISFPHRALSQKEMKKFLHALPKPDVLIVCDATREERKKRQEARGWTARDEAFDEYAEKNFVTALQLLSQEKIEILKLHELGEDGVAVRIKKLYESRL